jgi:hypothetical protein
MFPNSICGHLPGPKGAFSYRTLVSRSEIRLWKPGSIKGVGYLSHLYTRLVAGSESDDVEKWLEREFETPAAEPLRKAVSDERLTSKDWQNLVRFLAAQIVRTPAYFVNKQPMWRELAPAVLDEVIRDVGHALEHAKRTGTSPELPDAPHSDLIPVRVTSEASQEAGTVGLRMTVGLGRGMWLFAIKSALTQTAKVLHEHRWTILKPAAGITWFTSDDPVICLNYYDDEKYDFGGGWGRPGSEILLPLSPRHLLYTRIGYATPPEAKLYHPKKPTHCDALWPHMLTG